MRVRIEQRDEYSLPCKIADLSSTDGLTPWMRRWLDHDADEIHRALSAEWAGVRHPSVGGFCDVVLKFHPFALAHHKRRWYLALKHPDTERMVAEGTLYVESPLDPAALEKCLADHDLAGHDVMREFYTYFNGLREMPGHSGNFERLAEWSSLRDIGWDENEFDDEYQSFSKEWLDDIIVYTTLVGDMVLLKADGRTAWVLHEEHRIAPLAPSFSGFLDVCTKEFDRYFGLDYYHLSQEET
jgi:hypothetical protein